MEIINPCKHCGGTPVLVGRKKIRVVCTKCGASGAEKPLRSEAIENWNRENIIRCKDCVNYHPNEGWCDIHSTFVDRDGNPADPSQSSEWTMFEPEDFCSKAEAKQHNS